MGLKGNDEKPGDAIHLMSGCKFVVVLSRCVMLEISRFYGVRITMYYAPREHPPAHFHASKGDEEVVIDLATGAVIEGRMNKVDLARVLDWCALHRAKLSTNWTICMSRSGPLNSIAPLP